MKHRVPGAADFFWGWVKLTGVLLFALGLALFVLWGIDYVSDRTTFFEG